MAELTEGTELESRRPACDRCGGSGWMIVERDGISGAQRCQCASDGREERVESAARIPARFGDKSLENFVLPADNPIARQLLQQIMRTVSTYARTYPALDKPGLLFTGGTGTGKTHLAVAAFRALIGRGFEGLFFDYQTLIEQIRKSWNREAGQSDREAYENAMECDILLIDDLGAHRAQDWIEDVIHGIIGYRYNKGKTIIATTNLPDDDERVTDFTTAGNQPVYKKTLSEIIGARSSSRLHEMCKVIRMSGLEDYRMRKR